MDGRNTYSRGIAVDLRVSRALREYVICTNGGSDVLRPDRNSILWCLVKQHLATCDNWLPMSAEYRLQRISIELRNVHAAKIYNIPAGKVVGIDIRSRFFIQPKGCNIIVRYLNSCMKASFRDYMLGATSNSSISIADAIEEFCTEYDITFRHLAYDMFRKDWYRYRRRTVKAGVCPLLK